MEPTTTTTAGDASGTATGGSSGGATTTTCTSSGAGRDDRLRMSTRGRVTAPAAFAWGRPPRERDRRPEFVGEATRRERVVAQSAELYDLTGTLRRECPWDRKQTQEDIVAYTLEETYELVDAVRAPLPMTLVAGIRRCAVPATDHRRAPAVRRAAHAMVPSEASWATCCSRCTSWPRWPSRTAGTTWGRWRRASTPKLVRRHPHIFGEPAAETPEDVGAPGTRSSAPPRGARASSTKSRRRSRRRSTRRSCSSGRRRWGSTGGRPPRCWTRSRRRPTELRIEMGSSTLPTRRAGPPSAGRPRKWAICCSRWSTWRASSGPTRSWSLRASAQRFQQRVERAADLAATDGRQFEEIDLLAQEGYFQRAKTDVAERPGWAEAESDEPGEEQDDDGDLDVYARQILDSRGNPTVEVEVDVGVGGPGRGRPCPREPRPASSRRWSFGTARPRTGARAC